MEEGDSKKAALILMKTPHFIGHYSICSLSFEFLVLHVNASCAHVIAICFQTPKSLEDSLKMTAIFSPFLVPSPSERKMTSLLLNTMTSLLLIVTAFF